MIVDNSLPLSPSQKAHISDLADGQLRGAVFAEAMALLDSNSQARAYWHGLHVTGDALRGNDASHSASNFVSQTDKDMAFLDVFKANVAKELPLKKVALLAETNISGVRTTEANDSFFNWKWLGGLSVAAAVVAFSWNLVSSTATAPSGSGVQLAQSAVQGAPVATITTQTSAGVMLRNPQLDALIAAHNQVGGSSALQMPSGFLRSATFNTAVSATALSDK